MDVKGPGAVVRFWTTIAHNPNPGTLRLYIDGQLTVEGPLFEFVSGGLLCGAPLSDSVSKLTILDQRGHNLYLPIPYADSCKITYESALAESREESFYYNIETREYKPGTKVESFSRDAVKASAAEIAHANGVLTGREGQSSSFDFRFSRFSGEIAPGATLPIKFPHRGAISSFSFKLDDGCGGEAAKNLLVEMTFDGEKTVSMPAAYFFLAYGNGSVFKTRFVSASDRGVMSCRWWMPFAKNAEIRLVNNGKDAMRISDGECVVTESLRAWDATRSMHFGASCSPLMDIPTRRDGKFYDICYANLEGEGRIVGMAACVRNSGYGWWGEGDEKVYIDGEDFPSMLGTGTEDHYGYAWCNFHPFEHPFLLQADGAGAVFPGTVVNFRARVLDSVYFTKGVRYDMELWHWLDNLTVDYIPVAFWYKR